MNIDFLKFLETFMVVAEARNMTVAAQSLGVSQSAVSQQLHQLEADLGGLLFDRSVRPIALTAAGTMLHAKAFQLLNQAAKIRTLGQDVQS